MRAKPRRGTRSRCCDPLSAPYRWTDYSDPEHPDAHALNHWLASLAPFARAHAQGEINDLFEAAAWGHLEDSGDARTPIKPIREDPEIFELRHTSLSKKLRFYHGEPAESPRELIAVHRHIKTTTQAQQHQIEHAAHRYNVGRSSEWQ